MYFRLTWVTGQARQWARLVGDPHPNRGISEGMKQTYICVCVCVGGKFCYAPHYLWCIMHQWCSSAIFSWSMHTSHNTEALQTPPPLLPSLFVDVAMPPPRRATSSFFLPPHSPRYWHHPQSPISSAPLHNPPSLSPASSGDTWGFCCYTSNGNWRLVHRYLFHLHHKYHCYCTASSSVSSSSSSGFGTCYL